MKTATRFYQGYTISVVAEDKQHLAVIHSSCWNEPRQLNRSFNSLEDAQQSAQEFIDRRVLVEQIGELVDDLLEQVQTQAKLDGQLYVQVFEKLGQIANGHN